MGGILLSWLPAATAVGPAQLIFDNSVKAAEHFYIFVQPQLQSRGTPAARRWGVCDCAHMCHRLGGCTLVTVHAPTFVEELETLLTAKPQSCTQRLVKVCVYGVLGTAGSLRAQLRYWTRPREIHESQRLVLSERRGSTLLLCSGEVDEFKGLKYSPSFAHIDKTWTVSLSQSVPPRRSRGLK